jgi:hypothetical protein
MHRIAQGLWIGFIFLGEILVSSPDNEAVPPSGGSIPS